MLGKTDGVHRTPLQKLWYRRAPLKGRSKFGIEEQGFVRAGFCAALGLYQTLHDAEIVNQWNRKRCWSTALQKLLLQSFTPEA